MSLYRFIACEYELPTLYSPKLHTPNGRRITVFQSEEDLDDLEIIPVEVDDIYDDVISYTKMDYIYELNFEYIEYRNCRLYNYLVSNCQQYKKCEICTIWLVHNPSKQAFKKNISEEIRKLKTITLPLNTLTHDILRDAINSQDIPKKLVLY